MEINSLTFVVFVIIALIAYYSVASPVWRHWTLAVFNALFLISLTRHAYQLIPTFVFLAAGYVIMIVLRKYPRPWIAALGIALVIAFLIYFKRYSFLRFIPPLPFSFITLGLSYITFRIIHVILDVYQGEIKEKISLTCYFNYTCSFPAFISGPIQLYQDYTKQVEGVSCFSLTRDEMAKVVSRLFDGYLKVVFFSSIFFQIHKAALDAAAGAATTESILYHAVSAALYTLHLYFNFSGYVDIVVSVGHLFGFTLPENFNQPFKSENLLDFWARWHMSLSNWFKIYMFNPMLKSLMTRWPSKRLAPYLGVLSYFIVFFVVGLWHESLGVGIFFGFGVGLNKLYETVMRQRLGRKRFSKLEKNIMYRYGGRGFTYGYVSLTLICLWMGDRESLAFFRHIGSPGIIVITTVISALASVGTFGADLALRMYETLWKNTPRILKSYYAGQLWLAVKLILITFFFIHEVAITPDLIYKVF